MVTEIKPTRNESKEKQSALTKFNLSYEYNCTWSEAKQTILQKSSAH